MRPRLPVVVALPALLAVALAGCLAAPAGPLADDPEEALAVASERAGAPPTVVAVVDTGINPYHRAFRAGPSFADVPGFPADARALAVSLDAARYEAAVGADAALWGSVQPGELVWFPSTRLAAVSIGQAAAWKHPVLDEDGHGTVVSDAVFEASPHAVVVMVQVDDDETLPAALQWVAAQPWIDLVTVSWGTWLREYVEGEVSMGIPEGHRAAARAGKLVFNSAGNEPLPHFVGEHSGPPFVVAVGGAENASRGETRIAARFPDVLGPMWQVRAVMGSTEAVEPTGGTSLSGPYVAGVAAEALWQVRNAVGATEGGVGPAGGLVEIPSGAAGGALADGALTAQELREAMNLAAVLWGPLDWAPSTEPRDLALSNPVVVPAAQMGWGYVEPALAPGMAAHLLGNEPLPAKPADVAAFMAARQAARAAVWGDL